MNRICFFALSLSLLVLSLNLPMAFAGGRLVGNGGDVIVCDRESSRPFAIELLDHFEARVIHGLTIDFQSTSTLALDRVHQALFRIKDLSPDRFALYTQWANEFMGEAQFLKDIELVDIPDSEHIALPKDCRIVQIANQATVILPGQMRYTIAEDLWLQLNIDQKAGLILHEIVYREALGLNHLNSVASRRMASLLASPILHQIDQQQFTEILISLDFPRVRIQGALIDLFSIDRGQKILSPLSFYSSGILRSSPVVKGSSYHFASSSTQLPIRNRVEFYPQGQIRTLFLSEPSSLSSGDREFLLAPQILQFHSNGQLHIGVLEKPHSFIQGDFQLQLNGHIQFHENGYLHLAKIDRGVWNSPWGPLDLFSQVKLYANGNPQSIDSRQFQVFLFGKFREISGAVQFYSDLNLKYFWLKQDHQPVGLQNKTVYLSKYNPIELYQDGHLQRLTLSKTAHLTNSNGQATTYPAQTEINLSPEGWVLVDKDL